MYTGSTPLTPVVSQAGLVESPHTRPVKKRATPLGCSNGLLQSRDAESLHDLHCGLGLHHDNLAEDLALAGLGGRLHAGLHHDQTVNCELTCALDLLGADRDEALERALAVLGLETCLCSDPH